jgi:predicted nucleic-acid-binding Zn-ribbon protein
MEIACPKCGSHDLHADKKGFSGQKAVAGAVLTGGIGLLAGTIGSNKINITCLKCGNTFAPGDTKYSQLRGNHAATKVMTPAQRKFSRVAGILLIVVSGFFTAICLIVGATGETGGYFGALVFGLFILLGIFIIKKSKALSISSTNSDLK